MEKIIRKTDFMDAQINNQLAYDNYHRNILNLEELKEKINNFQSDYKEKTKNIKKKQNQIRNLNMLKKYNVNSLSKEKKIINYFKGSNN